jgi:hypothetical protein
MEMYRSGVKICEYASLVWVLKKSDKQEQTRAGKIEVLNRYCVRYVQSDWTNTLHKSRKMMAKHQKCQSYV